MGQLVLFLSGLKAGPGLQDRFMAIRRTPELKPPVAFSLMFLPVRSHVSLKDDWQEVGSQLFSSAKLKEEAGRH